MWPPILIVGILFAPESPWWLVRKGKIEDAKKSLLRLTSLDTETEFDADETVAMMVHTTALEEKVGRHTKQRYLLSLTEALDHRRRILLGLL